MSLGILVAPLLGGVVFQRGGYNAVFAMQYALIGVDILFRFLLVEKRFAEKWQAPTTTVRATEGQTVVLPDADAPQTSEKANDDIQSASPTSVDTKGDLAKTVASNESQRNSSTARRLPAMLTLLSSRRCLNGLWGIFTVASLMTSFDATLPIFVRETFNWDAIGAGLIFLPIVVPSLLGPLVGWISDRYGPRYLATAGFLSACPSLVLLRLVDHNSIGQKVLLCTLLTLIGVSLDLIFPPVMAEISSVVEAKERKAHRAGLASPFGKGGAYAQAYALFNVAWSAGAMVGPFWAGFVNDSAGWGTVGWSLGLLSGLSAIPTFMWAGGSIRRNYRRARTDSGSPSGVISAA